MTMTAKSRHGRAAILAGLILLSAVAGSGLTGLASAQTYEKTVTGSAENVVLDTTTISDGTTFTLEVEVSPKPGGGSKVVYREEHNPAQTNDRMHFGNFGAYENVTFRVSGVSSEPDIGSGSEFNQWTFSKTEAFLNTGGDRDFQCGTIDGVAGFVSPGYNSMDCGYAFPSSKTVNSTGLDANETKVEIYKSAATQADAADNFHTILNNRLQDTETVALTKGKGAYIRSLNNGDGQTAAEAAATQNITEYYSVVERNQYSQWNSQVENAEYLKNLAKDESGVDNQYIDIPIEDVEDGNPGTSDNPAKVNVTGFGSKTVTLQNGSNMDVRTIKITFWRDDTSTSDPYDQHYEYTIGPQTGTLYNATYAGQGENGDDYDVDLRRIEVQPPTDNQDKLTAIWFKNYSASLSEIDQQTTSANDQMSSVVNQTYDQYTAGEINSSDLVDPYVLQNQFNAGSEYQGWAAANLALLGTNQPTDLAQTGYVNITLEDGTQLQGIVQSRENPASGQFEKGQTYNPANINGTQWITTESQTRELTQNFTVGNITTVDGEQRTNFTIEKKTYTTTSAEDLKALNEELSALRAEIEARESALVGGGGGFGDFGGSAQSIAVVAGVVLVAYGFTRDD